MDLSEDLAEKQRIIRMRQMARKLAKNKAGNRTVRKLAVTMVVEPAGGRKRAIPMRHLVNHHKRLTYILLLGASLCAYVYDVDQGTLELLVRSVEQAANSAPAIRGHT